MTSHAQASQDLFAVAMTEGKRDGFYLDIGCYHPTCINNTYLLESEFGWTGILVDLLPDCQTRKGKFFQCDATKPTPELRAAYEAMPYVVDFLSLDVDSSLLPVFNQIPWDHRFRVACIEHDAYVVGTEVRDNIRKKMAIMGYLLVCADVCIRFPDPKGPLNPFEDWYVRPGLVKAELIQKFTCSGKEWTEIVKDV